MIYFNTKTRAVIDSPTPINGGNWVSKNDEKKKTRIINKPKQIEKKNKDDVNNEESDLTKADIMQELDSFGVEYNKRSTKKELLELLENISEEI